MKKGQIVYSEIYRGYNIGLDSNQNEVVISQNGVECARVGNIPAAYEWVDKKRKERQK